MDNVESSSFSGPRIIISFFWLLSLVVAGYIGFSYAKAMPVEEKNTAKNVLPAVATATVAPSPIPQNTPTTVNNNVCQKSGFAPKWEYLTPYVVKEGDSLQSIVSTQLKDSSRISEVIQINGNTPLVVEATIYLPPKTITKSTGNIKQVYGRLVEKNKSSWQLSFNGDKEGQGIVIPSFWFGEISGKDTYKIGDCLTILLDDGYKVFTVSHQ